MYFGWRRSIECDIAWLTRELVEVKGIMASQQEQIDTLVGRLNAFKGAVEAEIAALKADHPTLDLTNLEVVVSGLEADEDPQPQV